MKKVSAPKVVTTLEVAESPLPAPIQAALGELVGAAREGGASHRLVVKVIVGAGC